MSRYAIKQTYENFETGETFEEVINRQFYTRETAEQVADMLYRFLTHVDEGLLYRSAIPADGGKMRDYSSAEIVEVSQ